MLRRFVAWLRRFIRGLRPRRRSFRFGSLEFPPLDVEATAEQLRLRSRAQRNAADDLPPEDATEIDAVEEHVIQHVRGEVADTRAAFRNTYRGLQDRIAGIDLRRHTKALRNVVTTFPELMQTEISLHGPGLDQAKRDLSNIRRDYSGFRAERHIEREPDYPDSRVFNWGMLFLAFVAEAVLNAAFFAQGSMQGFTGGTVAAMILAFVDILIVFQVGQKAVWYNAHRRLFRVFGLIAFTAFLAWAIGYNVLVAHIREQLQAGLPVQLATETAWAGFLDNPLGLRQADSWILAVAGLAFTTMAFVSGLTWDDPMPGYGRIHRRLREAQDELDHIVSSLFDRVETAYMAAMEQLGQIRRRAYDDMLALENAIDTKRTLVANVNEFIGHYQESLSALLKIYRDENRRHRSTPAPQYFGDPVDVTLMERVTLDVEADAQRRDLQKQELDALEREADRAGQEIRSTYRRTVRFLEERSGRIAEVEQTTLLESEHVRES